MIPYWCRKKRVRVAWIGDRVVIRDALEPCDGPPCPSWERGTCGVIPAGTRRPAPEGTGLYTPLSSSGDPQRG